MFNVIELDKGKPATFKQGGNEMPVCVREKDFALALPAIRAWGVIIEGKSPDLFAELTKGRPSKSADQQSFSMGFPSGFLDSVAATFQVSARWDSTSSRTGRSRPALDSARQRSATPRSRSRQRSRRSSRRVMMGTNTRAFSRRRRRKHRHCWKRGSAARNRRWRRTRLRSRLPWTCSR